ncbi:unnamed protein product [Cuscuta europaea]|uniref:Integrase zinc-binding domain-containing protein n=1 Tax=Cuscuta europaea TaxID=41803 RepID=A0A9P0VMU4_CUSEU|nr:unnamed protein product [Cuscuta europaea]
MQRQSTYASEFYAITEAVAKFRHYLLGHTFIIKTDQNSLRSITDQAIHTLVQRNWIHKLMGYDFSIEYKLGKENIVAESLSRCFLLAFSQPNLELIPELRKEITQDSQLSSVLQLCFQNMPPNANYSVVDQLLCWKGRLVLSKGHVLVTKIMREFHSTKLGGHAGFRRTLHRIASQLFCQGMHKDIKEFVQKCLLCQQAKHDTDTA